MYQRDMHTGSAALYGYKPDLKQASVCKGGRLFNLIINGAHSRLAIAPTFLILYSYVHAGHFS
jgi:hypothetical protein